MFKFLSVLGAVSLFTFAGFAGLPEGSFKGESPLLKDHADAMALLIRKDPGNSSRYYAILAEYDRVPVTTITVKTAITSWVPRMYIYQIDHISGLKYSMTPLKVSETGEIEADNSQGSDLLSLRRDGAIDGAVVRRYKRNTMQTVETITFNGRVGSTWEKYVPGTYFGTNKNSGGDYFSKEINMELSPGRIANFAQKEIKGQYIVQEKLPGIFTFQAIRADNVGNDKVVTRIGVFVDIVNWKPLFTTDELLLINPENPADVGFYYERH